MPRQSIACAAILLVLCTAYGDEWGDDEVRVQIPSVNCGHEWADAQRLEACRDKHIPTRRFPGIEPSSRRNGPPRCEDCDKDVLEELRGRWSALKTTTMDEARRIDTSGSCERGTCYQRDMDAFATIAGLNTEAFNGDPQQTTAAVHGVEYDILVNELRASISSALENDEEAITLVSQCSFDRINGERDHLRDIALSWRGPVSLAVLIRSDEELVALRGIHSHNDVRSHVTIHVVRPSAPSSESNLPYPINMLRNVASLAAHSEWHFVTDIDVWIMQSESVFRNRLAEVLSAKYDHLRDEGECAGLDAYVIAAFEPVNVESYGLLYTLKQKRPVLSLDDLCEQKHRVFQDMAARRLIGMCPVQLAAYHPTRFERWITSAEPYSVQYTNRFEPYFIARRGYPPFEPSFVGYGWNYVAQTNTMALGGYHFIVDPYLFVVNQPGAGARQEGMDEGPRLADSLRHVIAPMFGCDVPSVRIHDKAFFAKRVLDCLVDTEDEQVT